MEGVKISCVGDKSIHCRQRLSALHVPMDHPAFRNQTPIPISKLLEVPLLAQIRSIQDIVWKEGQIRSIQDIAWKASKQVRCPSSSFLSNNVGVRLRLIRHMKADRKAALRERVKDDPGWSPRTEWADHPPNKGINGVGPGSRGERGREEGLWGTVRRRRLCFLLVPLCILFSIAQRKGQEKDASAIILPY